jgi:hypothetical protein
MKPVGLFGPGDNKRAMMPATKPITMIQMMPDTMVSSGGLLIRYHSTGAQNRRAQARLIATRG